MATFWKLFSQILPCFPHLRSPTSVQTREAAWLWALAPAHPGQGGSSYFFTELCLVPKLPRETVLYCRYYFYTCSFKALPCLWLSVPGPMARQRQQLFWSCWPHSVQLHHVLLCSSLLSSLLLPLAVSSLHFIIINTSSKYLQYNFKVYQLYYSDQFQTQISSFVRLFVLRFYTKSNLYNAMIFACLEQIWLVPSPPIMGLI